MINHKQKIKLIYISSSGRSGSTLLDMLLGKHNQCYTLGEFQMMPIDFKNNTQPCGCSKKVSECELWTKIYNKNREIINNGIISRFREFDGGKVLRWAELLEIFFSKPINNKQIELYGKDNYQVLDTVYNQLQDKDIRYFVDASKDSYRLKWLIQSAYFDVKVLHIIKKPEAFVYSMTKDKKGLKRLHMTLRMTLRWIVENSIIYKVAHKYAKKDNYYKVNYEELAGNFDNEINNIFNFLELEMSPNLFNDGFMHKNHAISGNFMRFKSPNISLDEKWKYNMGLIYKNIVNIIAYPFNYLYK
jgi:hypothetical protein